MENNQNNKRDILIYQSQNGQIKVEVRFEDETVWLTQQQMAELYQCSRTNVVEHIKHIYEDEEIRRTSNLSEKSDRSKWKATEKFHESSHFTISI